MKKVSIIIVNWNGQKHLKRCLDSVFSQTYPDYEVILVDNNSSDNSVTFVRNNFPEVTIMSLDDNYGFAEGNNLGFKRSKGDYVLLLNNDTYLENDTIELLVNEIERTKDAGVLQPKIVLTGDRGLYGCGSFLTNTGFPYHYGFYGAPDDTKYNKKLQALSVKGACMLIKREVIDKAGLFDADYFAFVEEYDFCQRAWLAGYKIYYAPIATMYHVMGGTTVRMGKGKVPPWLQFCSYRNRICSHIKNLGTWELLKILPLHLMMVLSISLLYLLKGQMKVAKAVFSAIWWNLKNLKSTLVKRKQVQYHIRKVSDEEIMPYIKKSVSFYYFLSLVSERSSS